MRSIITLVPLFLLHESIASTRSFTGIQRGSGGLVSAFRRRRRRRIPHGGFHDVVAASQASLLAQPLLTLRGGYEEEKGTGNDSDELSEKVRRAMIKLGLSPPDPTSAAPAAEPAAAAASQTAGAGEECEGGVCELVPPEGTSSPVDASLEAGEQETAPFASGRVATMSINNDNNEAYDAEEDADVLAARLSSELNVDEALCLAAIGATATVSPDGSRRKFSEGLARELLRQELDRISTVGEDTPEVQELISEGYDSFLSRRALAFADGNLDDARAILDADRMDEADEEEQKAQLRTTAPPPPDLPMKTVTVDSSFDPTQLPASNNPPASPVGGAASSGAAPMAANKADVVFDATAAQIQELVLESPVPVLLDVYADWCGPCKVLGPALEEMAVKSGGAFRLVKVNSDQERAIASSALGVTALPTVFGIRNGKILNMFQGMPRSQDFMKSFMMGLMVSESEFDPPVTPKERQVYGELTAKLIKMAGSSSFPFSARERLQDRIVAQLDELAAQASDFVEAEESTQVLKSLMSNVVRDPASMKFRTINLSNKVISTKLTRFPPGVAILKLVGFVADGIAEETLILGKGKKVVNVAPLMVARECIEKWVDKSRYEVAKAARRRRDEEERAKLQLQRNDDSDDEDDVETRRMSSASTRDPDACVIKVRFDGKNKIHELTLRADDPLSSVLERLSVDWSEEEIQITCVAKRLTISSADPARMQESLRSLGLSPSSYLVVSIGDRVRSMSARGKTEEASPSLAERSAAKQKQQRKRGSHTMQSVGIYAKDDNNKAELIDGGGGVWYEHDVSDDEQEEEEAKEESGPQAAEVESAKEFEDEDDDDDEVEVVDFDEDEESEEKEEESDSSDSSDEG
jgi:thiol-disulfide isomerase/thioredoxin